MLTGRVMTGNASGAAIIAFLMVCIGTSVWLAWSSVRRKQDVRMLTGRVYRTLATLNILAGLLLIALALRTGYPLPLVLSLWACAWASRCGGWCFRVRGPALVAGTAHERGSCQLRGNARFLHCAGGGQCGACAARRCAACDRGCDRANNRVNTASSTQPPVPGRAPPRDVRPI